MNRMSPDARGEQDGAAGKRDYIRGKLSGKVLCSVNIHTERSYQIGLAMNEMHSMCKG